MIIEICANSVQSAIYAQQGNAQRIELCCSLELGGISPSAGTILRCRQLLHIHLFVLIRPRAGDFCYSEEEFETMKTTIEFCKQHMIDGIVIGLLNPDRTIDLKRTKELVKLARPMQVTFHRAFDSVKNPLKAVEQLIDIGIDRILTSGQKNTAIEGKELIHQLVLQAKNRISIMPGAGINAQNIETLIETTKATEYHLSAKSLVKSNMTSSSSNLQLNSSPEVSEFDYYETDLEKVRTIVRIVNGK